MSKELYTQRILKKYGLFVDFDGEPDRTNVPPVLAGETFKQWCARVLAGCSNVRVYMPRGVAPQRKIAGLQREAQTDQLERVFRAVRRSQKQKDGEKQETAVSQAKDDTQKRLTTVSSQTIDDLIKDGEGTLHKAVSEFLARLSIEASSKPTDIEEVLGKLVAVYDAAVKSRNGGDSDVASL